jgi:hypothetical protein
MHAHYHTGSGTTGSENANHTHAGSGNTGTVSADHTHSGTTAGDSPDHTHGVVGSTDTHAGHQHDITGSNITNTAATGGNSRIQWSGSYLSGLGGAHAHSIAITSYGASARHTHTFTTGGISANHTHAYSFTTGIESVVHAHGYSFTTDAMSGTWGNSQNIPPALITNYIIFTGV